MICRDGNSSEKFFISSELCRISPVLLHNSEILFLFRTGRFKEQGCVVGKRQSDKFVEPWIYVRCSWSIGNYSLISLLLGQYQIFVCDLEENVPAFCASFFKLFPWRLLAWNWLVPRWRTESLIKMKSSSFVLLIICRLNRQA